MVCTYYSDWESSSFRDGLANLFLALDDEAVAKTVFRRYHFFDKSPAIQDFDKHWQLATSALADLTQGQYSSQLHMSVDARNEFNDYLGRELSAWQRYFNEACTHNVIRATKKRIRASSPCLLIRKSQIGMVCMVSLGKNNNLYHGTPLVCTGATYGILEVSKQPVIDLFSLSTS